MRIIAGHFRGRRLLGPADLATRPVTDRVKQRVFDWLTPRLGEALVYDCFAGTGSFGLESLSRGASSAVFFERYKPALERLNRNIDTLAVRDQCRLVTGDITKRPLIELNLPTADLVFFDPPYRYLRDQQPPMRKLLGELGGLLAEDGLILVRHDTGDTDAAATCVPDNLAVDEVRAYGSMTVTVVTRADQTRP